MDNGYALRGNKPRLQFYFRSDKGFNERQEHRESDLRSAKCKLLDFDDTAAVQRKLFRRVTLPPAFVRSLFVSFLEVTQR
jgi:hypothetical protein